MITIGPGSSAGFSPKSALLVGTTLHLPPVGAACCGPLQSAA
jgi:hypothetical protein